MTLTEFNAVLEREFQGRLRARRSAETGDVQIEERVGRGIFDPPTARTHRESDRWIRARDGYTLVMAIKPGDRMACSACGLTVKVPVLRMAEAPCPYCRNAKKRDSTAFVGFYPLGWTLIDHLKNIDPLRGGLQRQMADIEASNYALQQAAHDDGGLLGDVLKDELVRQIPQVGYTGPGVL